MNKFCENCGTQIESEDQKYCLNCGHNLRKNIVSKEKPQEKNNPKDKQKPFIKKLLKTLGIILALIILLFIAFIIYALTSAPKDNTNTANEDPIPSEESIKEDSSMNTNNSTLTNEDKPNVTEKSTPEQIITKDYSELDSYLNTYSIHLTFTEYDYAGEEMTDYIGQTYVDLIKFQKDNSGNYFINLSTPVFNKVLAVESFTQGELLGEQVTDTLAVEFKGTLNKNDALLMSGQIHLKDSNADFQMLFDYEIYPNTALKMSSINNAYELYFRNRWQSDTLYSTLPKAPWLEQSKNYKETDFEITYDSSKNQVTFRPVNNLQNKAVYQLYDNQTEGYLLETSIPVFGGESIYIRPISHPKMSLIELIIYDINDTSYSSTSLEAYSKTEKKEDLKEESDISQTTDKEEAPTSWYGTEELPFFMIIDQGKLNIPNNATYDFAYENELINFNHPGFLFTNAFDLMPFMLPYSKNEDTYKLDTKLYADEHFIESNMTKYFVEDTNGELYAMDSLELPKKISELPDSYLMAHFKSTAIVNSDHTLTYNISIDWYEEGYDFDNTDENYKEEYETTITLTPKK